jgi:hypothetical protein
MNVKTEFVTSPSIEEWTAQLVDDGWKIINNKTKNRELKKEIGNISEYPERQKITWYLTLDSRPNDSDILVSVDVPVFASSLYAKNRLLGVISQYADAVDGDCITNQSLEIDIMSYIA